MRVRNRLAEVRRRRGLSVAELATRAGVKRQTIYAVEGNRYIPNTLVALRLAQILEARVEELFHIETARAGSARPVAVELLSVGQGHWLPGQPVRLAGVGRRTVAVPSSPVLGELPAADAVVEVPGNGGKTLVRPLWDDQECGKRLIIAGCDPAMPMLARRVQRCEGIEIIVSGCSSQQALKWLASGTIHIAGTHLGDKPDGGSNLPVIEKFFPKRDVRVVTFAIWEEGLVVAAGNPGSISGIEDLARPDVEIINRETGAGARLLLDTSLRKNGIPHGRVRGYDQTASGHVMAAWHVHSGKADCCIATRGSARVFGLHFIPLAVERYDLVIPCRYMDEPSVQSVLDALGRSSFRHELEALGGYDTSETGRMVL